MSCDITGKSDNSDSCNSSESRQKKHVCTTLQEFNADVLTSESKEATSP